MACIYYIKHKETGRTYIGQTVQPLEQRLKQHLVGSIEIDRALQTFGLSKFEYGVLEQCKSEELDEKEIYYIAKYDTYYNGYNNQLGGRKTGQNKYDSIIKNIRQDYINGVSIIDINIKYKIKLPTIRYFVQDLIQPINSKFYGCEKRALICYNKNWERVHEFESINEAYNFVISNGYTSREKGNFFYFVRAACIKLGICCGFRWQYKEDVIYENKEFNSTIDKLDYIDGIECTCIQNIWFSLKNYKVTEKINNKDKICKQCGKMGVFSDNLCSSCYNVKIKGKSPKPSKEQLMIDLEMLTIEEIAKKYDRTKSTIYYWLSDCGIKQKTKRDTANKLIHCIELSLTFNTLRDAAKVVYKSDSDTVANRISQAAKSGKPYKGYHWKLIDKH
ncbi:MAG: GIY-YIG nuclease family protein [Lachnospiraceae bacterium]|nr:GIY-YIG nuclease family protein [Lachnospiraceae bacterium]